MLADLIIEDNPQIFRNFSQTENIFIYKHTPPLYIHSCTFVTFDTTAFFAAIAALYMTIVVMLVFTTALVATTGRGQHMAIHLLLSSSNGAL